MRLHLLAAPRLLVGGQAVHVGSRKAFAILALLALDGHATRDRLSLLLWPDADAAAGRRNLRRELFRLRQLGVPLEDAADAALALAPALTVDALQLLREGRLPDDADSTKGIVLEGLDGVGSIDFDGWLQRWRAQIAHLQGQLLDREAQACEQRGDLLAALALQRQRWAAETCNEAAALQVMRLLVTLGDRAGAALAFQCLSDALHDELGMQPSQPVQDLARELRGPVGAESASRPQQPPDPGRTFTRAGAEPGLAAEVPFVPRAAAQQAIEAAWAAGQRVYLHGAAGAGKSRLACEMASARGPWLRVACEPQDNELPYSSVVRVLRALRESAPDVALPDWVRRELAQLMPELGPPPQAQATDEARQRLLAAVAESWRLLMHDNFSAMVLDDWHWGDAASVELWAGMNETAPAPVQAEPVAWIIAYRGAQLPPAALQRQRSDVDSGRGAAVALEGMDQAEVLAFTRLLSGSPGGRLFSQRLHAATQGNPFFLLETLRHLFAQRLLVAEASGWSTPFDRLTQDYAELPVPPSVRAAVQARVRALGAPVQRLLELASLCSGDVDASLLAGASALDEEAVIAALDHAQAAQLVRASGAGWRFVHDLVRQSLLEGISAARQRLLNERVAAQLQQRGAAPALVAAQWEAAQRPAAAVPWRIAAAESALRVHALNESLAHYAQALADGAPGSTAVAVHLAMARVHARRSDRAGADAALASAGAAAAGSTAEVLQVQLACAGYLVETERDDLANSLLDAVEPEVRRAPPAQRAQALTARASLHLRQGRHNEARALMQAAELLLDGVADCRPQLAALLVQMVRLHERRGDNLEWGRVAARAVAVHESIADAAGHAMALILLGTHHIFNGQREQGLRVNERARQIAQHCGSVTAQRGALFNLVQNAFDTGDSDGAMALLDEYEALAPGFERSADEQRFLGARLYLHFLRGDMAAGRRAAERVLALSSAQSDPLRHISVLHTVFHLDLLGGDLARARVTLDEAQALCDAQDRRTEGNQFAPAQATHQAWLALAEGRPAQALALLPETDSLQQLTDRFACAWIGCAAERALGDRSAAQRRLDKVHIDDDMDATLLVLWLEQRLMLAAETGLRDTAAQARALALLGGRQVPALLVERLQRAVGRAAGGAGATVAPGRTGAPDAAGR